MTGNDAGSGHVFCRPRTSSNQWDWDAAVVSTSGSFVPREHWWPVLGLTSPVESAPAGGNRVRSFPKEGRPAWLLNVASRISVSLAGGRRVRGPRRDCICRYSAWRPSSQTTHRFADLRSRSRWAGDGSWPRHQGVDRGCGGMCRQIRLRHRIRSCQCCRLRRVSIDSAGTFIERWYPSTGPAIGR